MSKFIIVQNLKTLRRGPNRGLEDEVVFLHKLLNHHLRQMTQLPMVGPDGPPSVHKRKQKLRNSNVHNFHLGSR